MDHATPQMTLPKKSPFHCPWGQANGQKSKKNSMAISALFFLALCFHSHPSHAQLFIIQTSDQHSEMRRMITFLKSLDILSRQIKSKHPKAKLVLLVNGDFSGTGPYSRDLRDEGQIGYDMLAEAKKSGKYEVIFVFGNHEGFDWGGARGNALFLRQMQFLKSHGIPVVAANAKTTRQAAGLFQPYVDVSIPQSEQIDTTQSVTDPLLRIIGMTLERFHSKTSYDPRQVPLTITEIDPSVKVLKRELKRARRDHIPFTAVAAHEPYGDLYSILEQAAPKRAPVPPLLFAAAGHNHEHVTGKFRDSTLVLESGHSFDFSLLHIEAGGQVHPPIFFDQRRQLELSAETESDPNSFEVRFANHVESLLLQHYRGDEVIGQVPQIDFSKPSFTAGRHHGGDMISSALVRWIQANTGNTLGDIPAIGIWNSSSWRRDLGIDAGKLTLGLIQSIYPMEKPVKAVRIKGSEAEAIIIGVKRFRESTEKDPREKYSPQLSPNLRVVDHALQIFHKGDWHSARSIPEVILGMDPFIAINGHKLAVIDEVFARSSIVLSEDTRSVLLAHFAPLLTHYCEEALEPSLEGIWPEIRSAAANPSPI